QLQEQINRDYPDYLIACVGGGSNAMGTYYHYLQDERVKIISAEAGGLGIESGETAATIHVGTVGIIHGFRTLLMQDEDGQITEPYSISAGLDYPGVGPAHAHFAEIGRTKVYAVNDKEALEAAFELTELEGIIPAIESAHALGVLKKEQPNFKRDDVVVLTVSGRGDKDMETYIKQMQ
ncbi:MAG: pyridoxal-phosphate dependent enzyme, partial [Paludibacter sp.]|nr:pyridoxal-phosphate dependent enzyme [Paludibacter sp.]